MTLQYFIEEHLIKDIEKLKENNAFYAFTIMSLSIEFLGKCLGAESAVNLFDTAASKDTFNAAINGLEALKKYRCLINKDNTSKNDWLYSRLRCGFAHHMLVKQGLVLSDGHDDLCGSPVTLGCIDFYDAFKVACNEVISKRQDIMSQPFFEENEGVTGATKTVVSK